MASPRNSVPPTAHQEGRPEAPEAGTLPIRLGEEAWSLEEAADLRDELQQEVARLREELEASEEELADLMRDYGGGSGDDSADTGGKVLEREQELTLTNNSRTLLAQTERALGRLSDHTYGLCESCEQPIGKMRLQAFPRATLCVSCKQKQERR
ncbi:MAG TPA: TraR/DksA C4-type zinc finger protein [Dermatophilaceae bacterium]|nr:TraR/DksA C4-type zinc finger protein [Dermatophilaceae bacterium]